MNKSIPYLYDEKVLELWVMVGELKKTRAKRERTISILQIRKRN